MMPAFAGRMPRPLFALGVGLMCRRQRSGGTEGSKPVLSSGESANHRFRREDGSYQRAVRRFQMPQDFRFGAAVGAIAFSTPTEGQSVRVPSAGIVIRAAARIEPHAAPGTVLCTEEFLSELDERSQPLFTRVTQVPLQAAGLLLGDDGVAVIRKNDHEEPVETRLFQAPLG